MRWKNPPVPREKTKKHQPGNTENHDVQKDRNIESVWNNHVWVHRILKRILDSHILSHIHWIALHRFPSTSPYLSNILLQKIDHGFCLQVHYGPMYLIMIWQLILSSFDSTTKRKRAFFVFNERKLSCDAAEAMAPAGESNARCAFQCAYVQVQVYIYIYILWLL